MFHEYKMTTIGKNIAKVYSIKNAMNIQANSALMLCVQFLIGGFYCYNNMFMPASASASTEC